MNSKTLETQRTENKKTPRQIVLRIPLNRLTVIIPILIVVLIFTTAPALGLGGGDGVLAQEGQISGVAEPSAPQGVDSFSSTGTISFQGELSDTSTGATLPDGDYKMRFAIYDAPTGGIKHWPAPSPDYEDHLGVGVQDGLFNVLLGSQITIPSAVFNAGDRYLQIWVCETAGAGCTTFDDLGRLPISSAAYTMGIVPGTVVNSTSGYAIKVSTSDTSGSALQAQASATSGNAVAVYGSSNGPNGAGISGYSGSSGYGVYGSSWNGAGIYGTAPLTGTVGIGSSTIEMSVGVYGETKSHIQNSVGVYGKASSNYQFSQTYGVYGISENFGGVGVYGTATMTGTVGIATTEYDEAVGVYGETRSTEDYSSAGKFFATGTEGNTFGIRAENYSDSDLAAAGYFYAFGETAKIYGVNATVISTGYHSAAGHFLAYGENGQTYGVHGENRSLSEGSAGVYGKGLSYGVYGFTEGIITGDSAGVYGRTSSDDSNGVWGATTSNSSSSSGVYGYASRASGYATPITGRTDGNGDIIELYSGTDQKFKVTNTGEVYADGSFHSGGGDFAELLPANDGLEPGDVLVIGIDGQLARSTEANQPTVVGVYSTEPGFLGGSADDTDNEGKVPLAVVGVVPVKVSAENGLIQPGDMLVASVTPGHAMKAGQNPANGTVIGKALESLSEGTGIILMLVILQ